MDDTMQARDHQYKVNSPSTILDEPKEDKILHGVSLVKESLFAALFWSTLKRLLSEAGKAAFFLPGVALGFAQQVRHLIQFSALNNKNLNRIFQWMLGGLCFLIELVAV